MYSQDLCNVGFLLPPGLQQHMLEKSNRSTGQCDELHYHLLICSLPALACHRKLDENDFKLMISRSVGALSAGVPSVGGFLAGFMIGLRI